MPILDVSSVMQTTKKEVAVERKTYNVDGLIKGGPYSHVVKAGGFLFCLWRGSHGY